jgi:hypothetical protein
MENEKLSPRPHHRNISSTAASTELDFRAFGPAVFACGGSGV